VGNYQRRVEPFQRLASVEFVVAYNPDKQAFAFLFPTHHPF
jgi:hypothetical protein